MQNQGANHCNAAASTAATVAFLLSTLLDCGHFQAFFFFLQLTLFTELSSVAGQADAGEGVDSIQTGGSIQARVGLALVDVCNKAQQRLYSAALICQRGAQRWLRREERAPVCFSVCGPVSQCCPEYPGAHMQTLCAPVL